MGFLQRIPFGVSNSLGSCKYKLKNSAALETRCHHFSKKAFYYKLNRRLVSLQEDNF